MDIEGVDRFWVKAVIGQDGRRATVLAVMTAVPLHPVQPGHDPDRAARLLDALEEARQRHGFDAVEVLNGG
jgi:hypothetical protein